MLSCETYSLEKLLAWGSAIVRILEGSSDVDLFIELATIGGHAKLHGIVLGLTRHQTFPSPSAMTSTTQHDKIQRLRRASIFAATPDTVLAVVADAVKEVQLAPNEQLFARGDRGTSMYVIVTGLVRVHIGDQTIVELSDGEIVGELAAVDPEPRSASVSAIDPSTLYQIEQSTLQGLMADHPEIVQGIIKELAHRLRVTTAPYGFSL